MSLKQLRYKLFQNGNRAVKYLTEMFPKKVPGINCCK